MIIIPGMFRWILDDTRALLANLRAAARRLSTRWQWWRVKTQRRVDAAAGDLENIRRGAASRTRMCTGCRALIPVDARRCPECGEVPGRAASYGVARAVENTLPGFVSASSIIITLNLLFYGLTHLLSARLAESMSLDGRGDPWTNALVALGAEVSHMVAGGELWRLLTMCFLHGNLLHLLMNCWALMTLGPLLEELYGARKFLFLYTLSGIGGSLATFWWRLGDPPVPAIGASGAIFGLLGVAAVWGWLRGGSIGRNLKSQVLQWAAYGLVMGVLFRFDNAAHLGGLVAGGLLALVVGDREPRSRVASALWDTAAYLCVLAVLVSFTIVVVRFRGMA